MFEKPNWRMTGVLTEKRELKTKKDEVWAYSFKIMALGGMYSVTTKDALAYGSVGEGETITLSGTFEQYNGSLQLALTHVQPQETTKSKAS